MASDDDDLHQLVESLKQTTIHEGTSTSSAQISANNNWKRSLIVKVLTSDQVVRFKSLQSTLLFIWSKYGIQRVSRLSIDCFKIDFQSEITLTQVTNDGPWNFNNDFLLIERMKPDLAIKEYTFNSIDLWVQLHDLPGNQLTPVIIVNLLHNYGTLFPIDPLAAQKWTSFARVRVNFPTNFRIMASAISKTDQGQSLVATLKFERLHRFCNVCCTLGHEAINCFTRKRILEAAQSATSEDFKCYLLTAITPKIDDSVKATHTGFSSNMRQFNGDSFHHYFSPSETSTGFNPIASLQVCNTSYPVSLGTKYSPYTNDPIIRRNTGNVHDTISNENVLKTYVADLKGKGLLHTNSTNLQKASQATTGSMSAELAFQMGASHRYSTYTSQQVCISPRPQQPLSLNWNWFDTTISCAMNDAGLPNVPPSTTNENVLQQFHHVPLVVDVSCTNYGAQHIPANFRISPEISPKVLPISYTTVK